MSERTFSDLPEDAMLAVNQACNRFERAWRSGQRLTVEQVLADVAAQYRAAVLRELLPLEIQYRQESGEATILDSYAARFPELDGDWLSELFSLTPGYTVCATPDELAVPKRLGDYSIVERIGGGGMGTVYKAIHERMDRTVALKVLKPEIQAKPDMLRRFDREVRAAARLSHVNIVAALDAREQDGVHFLITEFIDGDDLDRVVRKNGPLSTAAAVQCVLQAARGLDYAHRQGVIHRDIKPANLLRDRQGVVKILDMGLARLECDDPSTLEMTKTGVMMGTAAFMAPEQARDTRRADARSDIYSLGCTLYFLVTGQLAFGGETVVDTILSHVNQPIPSLTRVNKTIPQQLDEIFQRMVAKDPEARFQSAAQLVTALEDFLSESPDASAERAIDNVAVRATSLQAGPIAATVALDQTEVYQGSAANLTTALAVPAFAARSPAARRKRNVLIWVSACIGLLSIAFIALVIFQAVGKDRTPLSRNYALSFNGRDSYVSVPKLEPDPRLPVTLEAIVDLREVRTSNMISWLGPDWMALFVNSSGHWGVARRVGEESRLIESETPAVLGQKVHLAGVWDGENLYLFVDGKPAVPQPLEFFLPETSGGLFIGGVCRDLLPADQNDRFFHGLIDSVRISQQVRYTADFPPPAKLAVDDGTLALFEFNEGQGSATTDATASAYQGKIVNAEWVELKR